MTCDATTPILALDLATRAGWAARDRAGVVTSGWLKLADSTATARIVALELWLWPKVGEVLGHGQGVLAYELPALVCGRVAPHRTGCHLEAVALRQAYAWKTPRVVGATAAEIKKHATGNGRADKAAVVAAMRARWGREDLTDDNEADALALLALVIGQEPTA